MSGKAAIHCQPGKHYVQDRAILVSYIDLTIRCYSSDVSSVAAEQARQTRQLPVQYLAS